MSAKTKKTRRNFFQQDTEAEPEPEYKSMNPGELQPIIDKMWDIRPKDKRSKTYKEHVKKLNQLIDIYNSKAAGYNHAL